MVDRIGKGGPPPPTTTGAERPKETGKTFDVSQTTQAPAARPVDPTMTVGPLEQLKAGKIDFNQYVDLKVQEATSHLEAMSPSQIDSIRSMLRDRMATDPELVDLVKQATGHAPSVPEE